MMKKSIGWAGEYRNRTGKYLASPLIQEGYLQRTSRDRIITPKGTQAIGLKTLTTHSQPALF